MPLPPANQGLPFYVTRATSNGDVATYSANAYVALLVVVLLSANAVLWGVAGVVGALRVLGVL